MERSAIEKFHVKKLDCANCAAKIERHLKTVDGIDDATVDFANLTLFVKADDIRRVIEEVRRIEPAVELIPKSSDAGVPGARTMETEYKPAREMWVLGLATLLFGIHLLFETGSTNCRLWVPNSLSSALPTCWRDGT